METTNKRFLECDCIHDTVEKTMTHNWKNGRIKVVAHFEPVMKICVLIDEDIKCTYGDMTVSEFESILYSVQSIVDKIE